MLTVPRIGTRHHSTSEKCGLLAASEGTPLARDDPLERPVRQAPGANLSRAQRRGEHLQHRLQRRLGIVAVKEVEINVVGSQATQRVVKVGRDSSGGQPMGADDGQRMGPFGHQEQSLAIASGRHPGAQQPLGAAQLVRGRQIEGETAELQESIQVLECPVLRSSAQKSNRHDRSHARGAHDQARQRGGSKEVVHAHHVIFQRLKGMWAI
jgi:hypothetical protein